MHIPDGFLSLLVALIFWILSAVFIGIALQKTKRSLGERQVPLTQSADAGDLPGRRLAANQRGQEKRGKNGDDRDQHEQFRHGET